MKHIKDKFDVDVWILECEKIPIFNKYNTKINSSILKLTPDKAYEIESQIIFPKNKKFIEIVISGQTADGIDCIMPNLRYIKR